MNNELAQIRLSKYIVSKLVFQNDPKNPIKEVDAREFNINLNIETTLIEEDNKKFNTAFHIELCSLSKSFELTLDVIFEFDSTVPLDQQFLTSDFSNINAPAIAYPYLRSLITTISTNSGLPAIFIPAINFQALAKKTK